MSAKQAKEQRRLDKIAMAEWRRNKMRETEITESHDNSLGIGDGTHPSKENDIDSISDHTSEVPKRKKRMTQQEMMLNAKI